MHKDNRHRKGYNFKELKAAFPALAPFVIQSSDKKDTIDFADYASIKTLNQALLKVHYSISTLDIPDEFLIPPVPGRADYVHYLSDIKTSSDINILDIGTGASLIYPLLGAAALQWKFKAVDVNPKAIDSAQKQLLANPQLKKYITVALQPDRGSIFKNVISSNDYFNLTMCNPPFYTSEEDARKANTLKNKNLGIHSEKRNFKGVHNELWCNGGEALFIKRMIKESVLFKSQVGWFTTLVSQSKNLPKIYKQLEKHKATYKTIQMAQGNKKTRIVAWRFED